MKTFVACDWTTVERMGRKVRVPLVAEFLKLKSYRAHDALDGRAVCEFDCSEDRAIKGDSRFRMTTEAEIAPCGEPVAVPQTPASISPDASDCVKFACANRGPPIELTPCQLCEGEGKGTKLVMLHECSHFGSLCTVLAAGVRVNGKKAPVCVSCDYRTTG